MPHDALATTPSEAMERERDRVIDALTGRFVSGELSEAELEERLERAHRATTSTELDLVIADLPAAAAPLALAPAKVGALFSGHHARIAGPVARALRVRVRAGYVELDLTEAKFEPGVTEIDVRVLAGYGQIHLPADVRVDSAGGALLGYFSVHGGPGRTDVECVVRITGRAIMGFVECFVGSSKPPELPPGG
jgi:DUF1707 SHOCT-like domain